MGIGMGIGCIWHFLKSAVLFRMKDFNAVAFQVQPSLWVFRWIFVSVEKGGWGRYQLGALFLYSVVKMFPSPTLVGSGSFVYYSHHRFFECRRQKFRSFFICPLSTSHPPGTRTLREQNSKTPPYPEAGEPSQGMNCLWTRVLELRESIRNYSPRIYCRFIEQSTLFLTNTYFFFIKLDYYPKQCVSFISLS